MKRLFALLAPLLLTGCFLTPGSFTSSLDLRKDGTFTYIYNGEMLMQSPDDVGGKNAPKIWSEANAQCFKDGEPYYNEYGSEGDTTADAMGSAVDAAASAVPTEADSNKRKCTKAELETVRKNWDSEQATSLARKQKDSEQFAAMFGFNPNDEAQMQGLATRMMKFDGWKSVTYKGKGVFLVDYSLTSRMGHDFAFPILPDGNIIFPFITVRKRDDGKVFVQAPSFTSGGLAGVADRMKGVGGMAGLGGKAPVGANPTKGTFTVTTNGEVLTNNSEDGPVADKAGRKIVWQVGAGSDKVPEALVQLAR
jgi:hypothetical protein